MDIDFKWVCGVLILGMLIVVNQLQTRLQKLEKRVRELTHNLTEPYPSDTTEDMQAIKDAKALCKKMGKVFTFDQALQAVKTVREEKRRRDEIKGDAGGNSNKRTA